ncbi:EAP30/Vps36 family, putative [Trypanosoma equiperdum]|uniref:EAP30/Vps36 family, putative n=1 Tax=Trypanosoma equiperdum TaxID=5694 RepID=A0A1G4I340_TRYEQ|nr:EAP30/Vps36 family, putative [Trypanosoma equiperdum]
MRRGVGVAHVQKSRETKRQMTDLGAQLTAERAGQIADQLESLEEQLRVLARKHKDEIKRDPVVRARFKQVSDSLGVDLISSKKNVFAGLLGLGDFYYGLAGKVVEACMKEQKFFGSYVPLARVVHVMNKQYEMSAQGGKRCVISEGDVRMALSKLHVLGDGYNIVKLGSVNYIQTTPDGSRGVDHVPILEYVLAKQEKLVANYRAAHRKSNSRDAVKPLGGPLRHVGVSCFPLKGGKELVCSDAVGKSSTAAKENNSSSESNEDVPFEVVCVSVTHDELEKHLVWQSHRVEAALQCLVRSGSVWIESVKTSTEEVPPTTWISWPTAKGKVASGTETIYWFVGVASGN